MGNARCCRQQANWHHCVEGQPPLQPRSVELFRNECESWCTVQTSPMPPLPPPTTTCKSSKLTIRVRDKARLQAQTSATGSKTAPSGRTHEHHIHLNFTAVTLAAGNTCQVTSLLTVVCCL